MRKIFKAILKTFRIVLLIISIVLIVLTIIAVIYTFLESFKLDKDFSKQGFIYFIDLFDSFKTLIAATFIIIPVYIALETLISNINNQEGKALLDLRHLLNEPENLEIHKKLRGESGDWADGIPQTEKDNNDTWRKIDNYLGILELINILLDKNVISKENFDNQFGYRVDNVFENRDIKEYLDDYENKEIIWKELFNLFKKRNLK
jgi:hypothetical protein